MDNDAKSHLTIDAASDAALRDPGVQVQAQPKQAASLARLWPWGLLLIVALLLFALRRHIPFDFAAFARQLRFVAPLNIVLGLLAIYTSFALRATRWSILLAPFRKVSSAELLPSQLIGFTAVALFGRVADLARPYLVARRTETPVATQLAIYSIERAFDLAAAAILFSVTLVFAPRGMPHHEAFLRAGTISLAATLFLVVFACTLRFAGEGLSRFVGRLLRPLSAKFAKAVAARLLDFRDGFRVIASLGQLASAMAVSMVLWLGIALAYLESARAFRESSVLATMSFTGIMLLLATSLGASLLQLPVLGWFTQIAAIAAAYRGFYGVPVETASACGALTLLITSLSIIPSGLIAARLGGVRLRETARIAPEPAI